MRRSHATGRLVAHAALVVAAACGALRATEPDDERIDVFPLRLDTLGQRIEPGSREQADAYYASLGRQLRFGQGQPPRTLDDLLRYFGYLDIPAKAWDTLPSSELMDRKALARRFPQANELEGAAWDVLAAGFFAPKTSDVSGRSHKASWRKVIRLKPRAGSAAAGDQLSAMYFLSVVYVTDHKQNPFASPSLNVQVLLTRDPSSATSKLQDPAAFLIFDPADNYRLTPSTTTSWDAADPALTQGLQPYFVPSACVQCHGADPAKATPQFFDTDYWQDKVALGEDFTETVGKSDYGPLFDAGRDPKSPAFHRGMDVFRALNQEIARHNTAVDPQALSTRGANNWLRLHAQSDAHAGPLARAWPGEGGWDAKLPADRAALPLLNRYCYRCHGTIHYNVFHKRDLSQNGASVLDWLDDMIANIESGRMPLDRTLDDATKAQLLEPLRAIREQTPHP